MNKNVIMVCVLFVMLGARMVFPMGELPKSVVPSSCASSSSNDELGNILRQSGIETLSQDNIPEGLICVLEKDSDVVEQAKVTSFFNAHRLRHRTSTVKLLLDNHSHHLLDQFKKNDLLQYVDAYKRLMSGENGSDGLMWPFDMQKRDEAVTLFAERSDLLHGLALSLQKSGDKTSNDGPIVLSTSEDNRSAERLLKLLCKSCISSGNCFKCGALITQEDENHNEQGSGVESLKEGATCLRAKTRAQAEELASLREKTIAQEKELAFFREKARLEEEALARKNAQPKTVSEAIDKFGPCRCAKMHENNGKGRCDLCSWMLQHKTQTSSESEESRRRRMAQHSGGRCRR